MPRNRYKNIDIYMDVVYYGCIKQLVIKAERS